MNDIIMHGTHTGRLHSQLQTQDETPNKVMLADRMIYVLNAQGYNRWSAQVQPGFDDASNRVTDQECRNVAHNVAFAHTFMEHMLHQTRHESLTPAEHAAYELGRTRERSRLALLMESQHTWLTKHAVATLIRSQA